MSDHILAWLQQWHGLPLILLIIMIFLITVIIFSVLVVGYFVLQEKRAAKQKQKRS